MRFEFTYTIQDLREAVRASVVRSRGPSPRSAFGWLIFVAVAGIFFYWFQSPTRAGSMHEEGPRLDLMLVLIPAVLPGLELLLLLVWSVYQPLRLRPVASRDPKAHPASAAPAAQNRGARVLGQLMIGLLMLGVWWLIAPGPAIPVRPSRAELLWIALPVLLTQIAALELYGLVHNRTYALSQWNAKPGWRRSKVMVLDDDGLSLVDSHSQQTFRWEFFSRARETDHLLVFFTEENMMFLLPKRAVPDAQLNLVRGLVLNSVPAELLVNPGGFAVVPKEPARVLPAE